MMSTYQVDFVANAFKLTHLLYLPGFALLDFLSELVVQNLLVLKLSLL